MHDRTPFIVVAALFALAACGGNSNPAAGAWRPGVARAAGTTPYLSVAPQPLDFTMAGVTQSFVVNDPNYSGVLKFKTSGTCPTVAKISAVQVFGPNGTFDATSIGAGRCDVIVSDSKGRKVTETIHVTLTKTIID